MPAAGAGWPVPGVSAIYIINCNQPRYRPGGAPTVTMTSGVSKGLLCVSVLENIRVVTISCFGINSFVLKIRKIINPLSLHLNIRWKVKLTGERNWENWKISVCNQKFLSNTDKNCCFLKLLNLHSCTFAIPKIFSGSC